MCTCENLSQVALNHVSFSKLAHGKNGTGNATARKTAITIMSLNLSQTHFTATCHSTLDPCVTKNNILRLQRYIIFLNPEFNIKTTRRHRVSAPVKRVSGDLSLVAFYCLNKLLFHLWEVYSWNMWFEPHQLTDINPRWGNVNVDWR